MVSLDLKALFKPAGLLTTEQAEVWFSYSQLEGGWDPRQPSELLLSPHPLWAPVLVPSAAVSVHHQCLTHVLHATCLLHCSQCSPLTLQMGVPRSPPVLQGLQGL